MRLSLLSPHTLRRTCGISCGVTHAHVPWVGPFVAEADATPLQLPHNVPSTAAGGKSPLNKSRARRDVETLNQKFDAKTERERDSVFL